MTLKEVIKKEFHNLLEPRFSLLLIILLLPLAFTLLFGDVYHENVVKNIPLVIYDQDQTHTSRTLTQFYVDSERFNTVAYVDTQEELEEFLRSGKAKVALGIPRDFSKNLRRGLGTEIILEVNSANNMFANAALTSAQEINRTFTVAAGQRLLEGLGEVPDDAMRLTYPVRLGIRIINNPTNGYTPFMLSGLMMNGLQIALMLVFTPLAIRELKRKTYSKEVGTWKILFAKALPCWLTAIVAFFISLAVMHVLFDVPVKGSLFDLLLISGAYSLFVLCALGLFAACSPNEVMSIEAPLLYIMPGLLYSGLSWPTFSMNSPAYYISRLFPLQYSGDCVRDILLSGYGPTLWQEIGYMLLLSLIFFGITCVIFTFRRFHEPKQMLKQLLVKYNGHKKVGE